MKKFLICGLFILLVHQTFASELTPEQYGQNLDAQHPDLVKLMTPHIERLAPDLFKQKPHDAKERAIMVLGLIESTRNDKETPVAMPLLLCCGLIQDEEAAPLAKKQAKELFQEILQEARMNGVKDIYSFDNAK